MAADELADARTRVTGGLQRYLDAPPRGSWRAETPVQARQSAGAGNAAADAWRVQTGQEPPRWVGARTAKSAESWLADGCSPANAIRAGLAVPTLANAFRRAYASAHRRGAYPPLQTWQTATMDGASLIAQEMPTEDVIAAMHRAGAALEPFVTSAYSALQRDAGPLEGALRIVAALEASGRSSFDAVPDAEYLRGVDAYQDALRVARAMDAERSKTEDEEPSPFAGLVQLRGRQVTATGW